VHKNYCAGLFLAEPCKTKISKISNIKSTSVSKN
jgi:hypothetical protein